MLADHLLGKKHAKRAAKAENLAAGTEAPDCCNTVSGDSAMLGCVKRQSLLAANVGLEEDSLEGGCHTETPKPAAGDLVRIVSKDISLLLPREVKTHLRSFQQVFKWQFEEQPLELQCEVSGRKGGRVAVPYGPLS